MKLIELYQIGWACSKKGNKTRVSKSFYFANQHKYISPWFPKEQNCTEWFNKYVLRNRKPQFPSTLTLYEITRDVKSNVSSKQEGVLRRIVDRAYETKVIKQSDIYEFIEPILKEKGEEAKKQFYETLEKYGIRIRHDLKEQILNSDSKCSKCGSKELTSGYYSKIKKFDSELFKKMSREEKIKYMKDFEFAHKCLECGKMIWTGKPVTLFDETEAAGYGELMVQDEDNDDKVKFHFDQDMQLQEGDYSDLEPSDYKEEQDISNLINYYIKIFGVNKDKIKSAVERSKNPLKQKVLHRLEKTDDEELNSKLLEMSGVGGIAGFNIGLGSDDVTVDSKNIRHKKKKSKIVRREL